MERAVLKRTDTFYNRALLRSILFSHTLFTVASLDFAQSSLSGETIIPEYLDIVFLFSPVISIPLFLSLAPYEMRRQQKKR